MAHGGARTPAKPAAVSGPGALSQRTDGRPQPVRDLSNAQYGEGAAFRELQQGAAMATAPGPAGPPQGGSPGIDLSGLAGMGDPSAQPGTPVTDGAALGAGGGTDALGLPTGGMRDEVKALGKWLPVMIRVADTPGATPEFRRFVRQLLGNV